MGATLSPDYTSVAYRFDNVKPIFIIESKTKYSSSLLKNIAG
jgi:hypothetical protein